MGGGISIEDSRLPKVPTDGSTKEWKILLTKDELTEKYKEIDGITISDPGHLELRWIELYTLYSPFPSS